MTTDSLSAKKPAAAVAAVLLILAGALVCYRLWLSPPVASVDHVLQLLNADEREVEKALASVEAHWHAGQRVMLIELLPFVRHQRAADGIVDLLDRMADIDTNRDTEAWYREIWNEPYDPHPQYAQFKARLYSEIDPSFAEYFVDQAPATIRLDEIRWGGVGRDGIPPLKDPETVGAAEADYLSDTDVVFGVLVADEPRAYPKRILAWHEMVKDVVGGRSINGVYCTLCGSMIVYFTEIADGTHYELGTSGFLYRSNKLMYDHATKSLWSTIEGQPVVGELVGQGIQLPAHPVVTTTWGQWRTLHPQTRVLSLNTGHLRDYDEGVAYQEYFATDDLMFPVPNVDTRLKNKDEVFIVRETGPAGETLAIAVEYLSRHPVFHDRIGETEFVVLTDASGANRAYASPSIEFDRLVGDETVLDSTGGEWTITEAWLKSADAQTRFDRLPAHRAFWFGWHAAHPDTRLVK